MWKLTKNTLAAVWNFYKLNIYSWNERGYLHKEPDCNRKIEKPFGNKSKLSTHSDAQMDVY